MQWKRGLVAVLAWPALAGADPVRTMLQQGDLPAGPHAVTLGRVLLHGGEAPAWHVHAGIETGYILSGQVVMAVEGRPDATLRPGDSFLVPRGVPHGARAVGGDATLMATWVVDTGAPLSSPVAGPR